MEENTGNGKGNIKEETRTTAGKQLVSGSFIKELLGYISLLTLLTAIYIGNRFHAERITREAAKLQLEVKDLKAEALSTSADLMSLSKQSEVFTMVREKGLNLEELKSPPFKLLVDKK
jgi:hypothetical protein